MGNVNKVILVGNLGADPELVRLANEKMACNLRVATNEVWKDTDGQAQRRTQWHRVTVWGSDAENCARYLGKGQVVYIEGRIKQNAWEDKEGVKHHSADIVANRVVFLSGQAQRAA